MCYNLKMEGSLFLFPITTSFHPSTTCSMPVHLHFWPTVKHAEVPQGCSVGRGRAWGCSHMCTSTFSISGDHAQPSVEVSHCSADSSLVPACCPSMGDRKEKMGQCKGEHVLLPAPRAIFTPPPPPSLAVCLCCWEKPPMRGLKYDNPQQRPERATCPSVLSAPL